MEPTAMMRKMLQATLESIPIEMNRFRSVLIRWDKKVENYLGLLHLACAFITYRATGLLG